LEVAREARGARRRDPRCPDTPLAPVPARTSLYAEITDKIIAELEVHQRQDAVPPVFTSALEGG
jgi:hypothetical protein